MKISFYQHKANNVTFPLPLNYGDGFSAELEDGEYRIVNPRVVTLSITTFGVNHYYLSAELYLRFCNGSKMKCGYIEDKDGNKVELPDNIILDVTRDVTTEDIENYPDRWEGYDVGEQTVAFNSLDDIYVAIETVKTWFPGYEFRVEKGF